MKTITNTLIGLAVILTPIYLMSLMDRDTYAMFWAIIGLSVIGILTTWGLIERSNSLGGFIRDFIKGKLR